MWKTLKSSVKTNAGIIFIRDVDVSVSAVSVLFWGIGIGKKWPILYWYFSNIMLYYSCLQLYQLIIVQSSYLLFNNDEYSIYIKLIYIEYSSLLNNKYDKKNKNKKK